MKAEVAETPASDKIKGEVKAKDKVASQEHGMAKPVGVVTEEALTEQQSGSTGSKSIEEEPTEKTEAGQNEKEEPKAETDGYEAPPEEIGAQATTFYEEALKPPKV